MAILICRSVRELGDAAIYLALYPPEPAARPCTVATATPGMRREEKLPQEDQIWL